MYRYEIYNNIYSNNFNTTKLVARLDSFTGKTIWAKSIFIGLETYQYTPFEIAILDDNAWILTKSDQGFLIFGGYMKLDPSGNLIRMKIFSNTFLGDPLQVLYFLPRCTSYIQDDSILIINGGVNYGLSGVGWAEDSYVDNIIMGIDSNGDLLWATIFDYQKKYDSVGRIKTYESTVYTGIYAGYTSPTLLSLNGTNGILINIKMFTYFQLYVNDI